MVYQHFICVTKSRSPIATNVCSVLHHVTVATETYRIDALRNDDLITKAKHVLL
jgi:hypothetical protein